MAVKEARSTSIATTAWADGPDAAATAVGRARAGVGADPGLVLFFPDARLPARRAAAQAAAAAPGCPVAGMTADGPSLTRDGLKPPGCVAIAFDAGVRAGIGRAPAASRDLEGAGRAAAQAALAQAPAVPGRSVLLLFVDPEAGDQAAMIDGAYSVALGRVPLAGGGANGADPRVIAGERADADAVVAVAITSAQGVSVAQAHGCRPLPDPVIVTQSDGRDLLELDGRPAEAVYLQGLGHAGAELSDDAFERLAVLHPLAQPQLRGDFRLRHVRGRAADGGLACSTPLPPNAAVWFTEQSPETIVASARSAVEESASLLEAPPRAGLVFDCAARRRALGDRLDEEVSAVLDAFGEAAVCGLHTRGEVGRTRGAKGDRNHSVVVVAFA